jgi:pyridoxine kinase
LNVISIQSWVAYGHVGNTSAMFPLQRLGAEVWAINTVQFSNHTGYGAWTGHVCTGAQIEDLVDGIAGRGALASCDAVLSGYMGDPGIGEAIARTVERVKQANPRAIYCCDPVIGDDDGVYVRAGIPELIRDRAIPLADIITPNHFELALLTGMDCRTLGGARAAVAALHKRGPRTVLVTSLCTDETPADCVDLLVSERGAAHLLRTPMLPITVNGAGDAIAALFLFHRTRTHDPVAALELAGSSVFGLLRRTHEAGSRELLTVAAQDEYVEPSTLFTATLLPA